MESFFRTLKTELIYYTHYSTKQQAKLSVFEYIEVWYNRKRRHSALGNKSPLQYQSFFRREKIGCLKILQQTVEIPLLSAQKPVEVDNLFKQAEEWKSYTFRQGSKGPMTRKVHTQPVYLWSNSNAEVVEQYSLVISCKSDGTEVKYALAS